MCPGHVFGSRTDTVDERSTTLAPESDAKYKPPPSRSPSCLTLLLGAGRGTPDAPRWGIWTGFKPAPTGGSRSGIETGTQRPPQNPTNHVGAVREAPKNVPPYHTVHHRQNASR